MIVIAHAPRVTKSGGVARLPTFGGTLGVVVVAMLLGGLAALAAPSGPSAARTSMPIPELLTVARRFVVFHGVEPGSSPQPFAFNNS